MMDIKRDQMFPIPFPILWNVFITSNLLAANDEMSFFLYKATLKCAKSDQFCRPFQTFLFYWKGWGKERNRERVCLYRQFQYLVAEKKKNHVVAIMLVQEII